jgi:phosphate transport system permease protein
MATRSIREGMVRTARLILAAVLAVILVRGLLALSAKLTALHIASGTNALNVSIILGIMALPTIVSVAEDSLQAAGRELREGSYALGATRAETLFKVVIPAAGSGIIAAVILGVMRAVGETMVVWMASGNAAQIPSPWFNFLSPVRTLTATIAGDMGEADQVTGSSRYHVLFALALCLLLISFVANLASEWILRRQQRKLGGLK